MKPKVTLISSFSNPRRVLDEVKRLKKEYEVEVILPTPEWMERMSRLMGSTSGHFTNKRKLAFKRMHMETYFRAIREADQIHIFNIKVVERHEDLPPELKKYPPSKLSEKGVLIFAESYLGEKHCAYGYEYYGKNTLMEIGYAHALGKLITSYMEPSEPELRNLIAMQV